MFKSAVIMNKLLVSFFLFVFFSCSHSIEGPEKNEDLSGSKEYVKLIETSHSKDDFLKKDNIQFDIELFFGGKERLRGKMTLATNSSRGIIETKNGEKIIFKNDTTFYSPGMNKTKVRFDAYTWSYFFLFPFKLSDEGTNWTEMKYSEMNGKLYSVQGLSFDKGIGDAPDDWYQVYSDTSTNKIQVAAYIVTANKSKDEAELDPHAIAYYKYQEIEGIPLSTSWKFFGWNSSQGLTDTLGYANLSNLKFIADNDSMYVVPLNFEKIQGS